MMKKLNKKTSGRLGETFAYFLSSKSLVFRTYTNSQNSKMQPRKTIQIGAKIIKSLHQLN